MELPSLYPHQEDLKNRTGDSLRKNRAVILCAAPGAGKTRLSKWMLGTAASMPDKPIKSGHVLFCVHRRGLVDNASKSFSEEPSLPHGVIMSGREAEWGQRVQVASIDTLLAWFCTGEHGTYSTTQTYDLIAFDECVTGDAIVDTELGPMRLDSIPFNGPTMVRSYSDEKGEHFARILKWMNKGTQDTLEIHTDSGMVQCTPDHEIYTRRRGWVQAQHVLLTDEILAFAPSGTSWSRVTKIVQANRAVVYDIEVEESHCFFANNLLVHNCHSHISKLQTFLNAHNLKREELGLHEPFVLGLSATPQAKGLSDVFKEIVPGPSTRWLIENGYLSPFRYFKATTGKIDALVKRGDEFTSESVASAMEGLAGDLVRDWKRHAQGRATIGFFPRRSHAKEAQELLIKNGVLAEYVDGETPDDERIAMFKRLNDGEIDYICNVGIVERGTDIPRVGCVQMCTAVGSITRWRQMIGRGSRVHPEVPDCIVLDHGGNVTRHGFFEDDVEWTLDWIHRPAKTHKPKPTVACPSCGAMYRGGSCKACGYEPSKKDLAGQGLEFDGRELAEIKAAERPAKKVKTNAEILVESLYRAGRSNKTFKQALGMAYRVAEKQGTKFTVPRNFVVAGKKYETIPFGDEGGKMRVSRSYPFTIGDYSETANPYYVGEA